MDGAASRDTCSLAALLLLMLLLLLAQLREAVGSRNARSLHALLLLAPPLHVARGNTARSRLVLLPALPLGAVALSPRFGKHCKLHLLRLLCNMAAAGLPPFIAGAPASASGHAQAMAGSAGGSAVLPAEPPGGPAGSGPSGPCSPIPGGRAEARRGGGTA